MAGYRKLGRTADQRKALIRNQVTALLYNGKIVTTEAKAKEIKPMVDKIITKLKKISKDGKRITRQELSREEALEKFKDDPYKVDLINNMDDSNIISTYTQGDFTDLCRGPHVETVKELKHFKLVKFSGAYWKGDAKNKMLQRVYGICFDNEEDLMGFVSNWQ